MLQNTYLYEIRALMSMTRYQNKYRFKSRSVAVHEWSVSSIAMGLALWQKEFSDIHIDMGELLQKSLLHESLNLYLGDLQASKGNQALMSSKALMGVKEILYETTFKQLLPSYLQSHVKNYVLYCQDDTIEGKLFATANIIDNIIEAIEEVELGNKRVFEDILKEKAEQLLLVDIDVSKWFVAYCLKDLGLENIKLYYGSKVDSFIKSFRKNNPFDFKDYENTFGVYLRQIRDLAHTIRYHNLYRHKPRSVAEHSWSVGRIAHLLALNEKQYGNNSTDMYELLSLTIMHDNVEVITGDFLSGVKRTTASMSDAIEQRELEAFKGEIAPLLPPSWREEYKRKILNPKNGSWEGQLLAVADIVDTLFEAIEEIKLGNSEHFRPVLMKAVNLLKDSKLQSVQDFLNQAKEDISKCMFLN